MVESDVKQVNMNLTTEYVQLYLVLETMVNSKRRKHPPRKYNAASLIRPDVQLLAESRKMFTIWSIEGALYEVWKWSTLKF